LMVSLCCCYGHFSNVLATIQRRTAAIPRKEKRQEMLATQRFNRSKGDEVRQRAIPSNQRVFVEP
jgi:hypothetical protein